MESSLQALKHNIYELEYAVSVSDYDRAKNIARIIKDGVCEVENEINNVTNCATGVYYRHINTIEFLYKPVDVVDPYRGNYMEKYAAARSLDLSKAGAKNEHDRFWSEHSVLSANVFGLVPVGLISEMAAVDLVRLGWVRVNVDVLDFGRGISDLRNIYAFCDQSYQSYVALKEEDTDSTIVLKFAS